MDIAKADGNEPRSPFPPMLVAAAAAESAFPAAEDR
jgi:hypothetical protein